MAFQETLVTVAVPVHNGARWLGEALDSARSQSHTHLEILVYDDASTDGSADAARGLGDDRIKVIVGEKNKGVGAARQHLKTAARGDYIAWLDADDQYDPRRIEILLAAAREKAADIVIDSSALLDEAGQVLAGVKKVPDRVAADPYFTRLFERNTMNPHPLVSRACFEAVDFDTTLRVSEDYDFWLKASVAGFRFVRVDQVLHRYRLTTGSLSCDLEAPRQSLRRIYGRFPLDDLRQLYRTRGFSEGHVSYMACLQCLFRGDLPGALAEARKPWPGEGHACGDFYRGTLELACNQVDEAAASLRRHLERQPDSPAGWNNLGVCLHRFGRDAAPAWDRALEFFPGYLDALANRQGTETVTMTQLAARRLR